MSYIVKRGFSSLIPPKVASPRVIGSAPNAQRMSNVVSFYKALPRGQAEYQRLPGFLGRYKEKFFDKDSAKPFGHVVLALFAFGYTTSYFFHFRHQKH